MSDFSHPDPAQRPAQPPNPYGTPPAGPPGPVHGAPQPPPYAYQPSFQPAPDARRGPGGVAVAGLVVGGLALLGVVVLGLVLLAWWGGGFDEGDDLVGTAPQVTQLAYPGYQLAAEVTRMLEFEGYEVSGTTCPVTPAVRDGELTECTATVDGDEYEADVVWSDDRGHFELYGSWTD
ncbi:DUF4333 domain-containing protein [Angustibacter aerolatus]